METEGVEVSDEIYLSSALDDGFWAGVSDFFEDISKKERSHEKKSFMETF